MILTSEHWTFLELVQFFGPRVFFAVLCGGLIGLERELKNKPAGIKTNILICLGAAIYTSVSVLLSRASADSGHFGDPARVAAQIVSGIGFLGGGAIIQARGTVIGLTTAATIWVVAAIGICIGIGHPEIAVACSASVIVVLFLSSWFEDRILGRSLSFATEVVIAKDDDGQVRLAITQALAQHNLVLEDFQMSHRTADSQAVLCHYSGHRVDQKRFIISLWGVPGVREVRQI